MSLKGGESPALKKQNVRRGCLSDSRRADLAKKLQALTENNGFQIVQCNGQRIYEPSPVLQIPTPPKGSEIFIGNLPKFVYEDKLIPLFEKAGPIYKFRLMLDFTERTRGYAFATYFNREDAEKAIITMHGQRIVEGAPIAVYKSVDNRRLFVGNIPIEKNKEDVRRMFESYVEGLQEVIMYSDWNHPELNRGFAFLEFDSHVSASMARRQFHPRNLIGWNVHLYVDWAEPLPDVSPHLMAQVKVLYIKNLPADYDSEETHTIFANLVGRQSIRKTHKIKSFAFVHFFTRAAAEEALYKLKDLVVENQRIEVEWARPPEFSNKKGAEQKPNNFCVSVPLYTRKLVRQMVRGRREEPFGDSLQNTIDPPSSSFANLILRGS